jgi:hypothetical protein
MSTVPVSEASEWEKSGAELLGERGCARLHAHGQERATALRCCSAVVQRPSSIITKASMGVLGCHVLVPSPDSTFVDVLTPRQTGQHFEQ